MSLFIGVIRSSKTHVLDVTPERQTEGMTATVDSPRSTPSRAHVATLPVLVYGTLRRHGGANSRLLTGRATYGETIRVEGYRLLSNGHFPYAIPTPGSEITVEVVHLSQERRGETIGRLDALEGYREDAPEGSLYTREIVSWNASDGMLRSGFMYVPSASTIERIMRDDLTEIPSGDWLSALTP